MKNFIDDFNRSWLRGDAEALNQLLHEDVVFYTPGFEQNLSGRPVCVESFFLFLKAASVKEFNVIDSGYDVWDDLAQVHLTYRIEYLISGELRKEEGLEFWTLKKKGDTYCMLSRLVVGAKKYRIELSFSDEKKAVISQKIYNNGYNQNGGFEISV